MWAVKLCCNKIFQILIGGGLLTQIDLFNGHKMVVYMLIPLFAVARPSVVCLSVTLVRPTQAVQIFGNISTALGTLAIR